jgi:hypothetical protein
VAKNGGTAIFRLTYTTGTGSIDATVDMRGKKFTSDITSSSFFVTKPWFGPTFECQSPVSNMTISQGPQIVENSTVLDQPSINTIPSILPLTDKSVASGKIVGLSTAATDLTGNPVYSVSSATVHYAIGSFSDVTPPPRPSVPEGGGSYVNKSILTKGAVSAGNGFWSGDIPALLSGGRVWYYLEVIDTDGNYDILPEVGAYTYAQCDATPPLLSFKEPTTLAAGQITSPSAVTNNIEALALSFTTGIQKVTFKVTGRLGVPLTTMTESFPGSGLYIGSYDVPAVPDPSVDLSHVLTVTTTDQCGNTTSVTRNYN